MQFIIGIIVGVIGCIWIQSVGIESAKATAREGLSDAVDVAQSVANKSCLRNFHEQSNCYAQHSKQECDRLANKLCD